MRHVRYIAPLVILVVWASTSLYTVQYNEYAYITRFGEPIRTYDGENEAGLHIKYPWLIDNVMRIDRRLQGADLPAIETLTRDAANETVDKTLAVDAYMTWRISDSAAADQFIRTVGTQEQARRMLAPRINGRLASVISTMPLEELISVTDDANIEARTKRLHELLLGEESVGDSLKGQVRKEYGIEIVDLRIRRFSYPEGVRASIAERIRSERARKVADYESEGRRRAADILSLAEKEARTIEIEARSKKQILEGQADADADRIRIETYSKDPEFYTFLQKVKAYQAMLSDTKDTLLLSSKHPLFDLLLNPPKIP